MKNALKQDAEELFGASPLSRTPMSVVFVRLTFIALSLCAALLMRYVYIDVLWNAKSFAYMGIRRVPVSDGISLAFLLLAVLPSVWISPHVRRPSDLIYLFLYLSVFIPTAVLMPHISLSSLVSQTHYVLAIMGALCLLGMRGQIPLLQTPNITPAPKTFWIGLSVFVLASIAFFVSQEHFSLTSFSLIEVYDLRKQLKQNTEFTGAILFYLGAAIGMAVGPFFLSLSFRNRKPILFFISVILILVSFIATSNKILYMSLPAVAVVMVCLIFYGRYFGHLMMLGAVIMMIASIWADRAFFGGLPPAVSWFFTHRIFTNNGELSAIYLEYIENSDFFYYSGSFMRWLTPIKYEEYYASTISSYISTIPGGNANANLWGDAYANAGYPAVFITTIILSIILWIYDSLARTKDFYVVTAALIMPASSLANAGVFTVMLTNGFAMVILLVAFWPPYMGKTPPTPYPN